MSVSTTLANALTGLSIASRRAQLISSNVANAQTNGYGRRELEVSSSSLGGAQIDGVNRRFDAAVVFNRRVADAAATSSETKMDFFDRISRSVGFPGSTGSLNDQVTNLASSLIAATSSPDSPSHLRQVLYAVQGVSEKIRSVSNEIQAARKDADANIAQQIDALNRALSQVKTLNAEITRARSNGTSNAALKDERQAIIDGISTILPIRQHERANGQVALFTTSGATLIDGKQAEIKFNATVEMDPYVSTANLLSGLTINGQEVDTGPTGMLAGGSLIANFEIRDTFGPEAQAGLDAFAAELISRFQDTAFDMSLLPGQAGLFTDFGQVFDEAQIVGISQRIMVNPLADPSQGGDLWKIQSGLGATSPTEAGDTSNLIRFHEALVNVMPALSSNLSGASDSINGFATRYLSDLSVEFQVQESSAAHERAKFEAFRFDELRNGVDTDQELSDLLQVESAHAANARVIQTVDEMIKTMLGI